MTGGSRFGGRRMLVTGGASGIGAATCRRLVAEGAMVAMLDRDAVRLADIARELGATALVVDLASPAAVQQAVDGAAQALGGLDGIVNAAGISLSRPFAETDLASWQRVMDVNLTAVYTVCHAALPHLRAAEMATIVNISSAAALQPLVGRAAYAAAKSGVIAFTKVLAMELAPNIRCNVLCPGAVDTPMVRDIFTDPAAIARIESRYALQRMAAPEELADAILYLSSRDSSYVTGITLAVDGGRTYH